MTNFGLNLLLYTTNPDESMFPICDKLKEMGYSTVEWPIFAIDKKAAKRIGKYTADSGLQTTTVHVLGPDANPISDHKSERKAALADVKKRIDFTVEMGGKLMCGPIVQPLGQFTGLGPTADERKHCVDYLEKAGEYAKDNNVTLCVEYLNRFEMYFLNTAADAAALRAEVDSPNVQTMVDSFHMNIEEKSFYDPIMAAKKYLAHVHVSENDRGIPGSGDNIRWDDFFKALNDAEYDGCLMIESFGQFLPDLAAAAKIWRSLFADPMDVCKDGLAFLRKMTGQ